MDTHGTTAFCSVELHRLWDLPADAETASALGPEELERVAAMRAPLRRRQYMAGHWLARRMAGEHHGGRPCDWEWQTDVRGQPRLRRGDRHLCISVSHSGDWLACALSDVSVGIDVEVQGRRRDWARLVQFAFPTAYCESWRWLSDAEQAGQFLRAWCLHEARGKRGGEGIQVSALRSLMPVPCGSERADALLWSLPDGFLALAIAPGTAMNFRGIDDHPTAWRFEPVL